MATPIYLSTNGIQGFFFLYILTNSCYFDHIKHCLLIITILMCVTWHFIVVSICISLIIHDIEWCSWSSDSSSEKRLSPLCSSFSRFFGTSGFFVVPRWYSGKEYACQCRRCKRHGFNPWVRKILWRREWQSIPGLLPGESHGQRSLVGYGAWGHKRTRHDWTAKHIHMLGFFVSVMWKVSLVFWQDCIESVGLL